MEDIGIDHIIFEGKDVKQAQMVRSMLLTWNAADYWFYVHQNGVITAANHMAGRLSLEKVAEVKEKAKEFAFSIAQGEAQDLV